MPTIRLTHSHYFLTKTLFSTKKFISFNKKIHYFPQMAINFLEIYYFQENILTFNIRPHISGL